MSRKAARLILSLFVLAFVIGLTSAIGTLAAGSWFGIFDLIVPVFSVINGRNFWKKEFAPTRAEIRANEAEQRAKNAKLKFDLIENAMKKIDQTQKPKPYRAIIKRRENGDWYAYIEEWTPNRVGTGMSYRRMGSHTIYAGVPIDNLKYYADIQAKYTSPDYDNREKAQTWATDTLVVLQQAYDYAHEQYEVTI